MAAATTELLAAAVGFGVPITESDTINLGGRFEHTTLSLFADSPPIYQIDGGPQQSASQLVNAQFLYPEVLKTTAFFELRAFLVSGADRVGEGAKLMAKLAAKRINVIAIDAVCAGSGRYGAILWVSPGQYGKAARALGAR